MMIDPISDFGYSEIEVIKKLSEKQGEIIVNSWVPMSHSPFIRIRFDFIPTKSQMNKCWIYGVIRIFLRKSFFMH